MHSSFYVDLTRKTIDQNLYISKQIGTYELPLELNGTTTIHDNMDVSSFQKYSDTNNAATTQKASLLDGIWNICRGYFHD